MPATQPAPTATNDAPATKLAKDPEASALAVAARDIARAAGLKSAYTPGEARGVLDHLAVETARGTLVISKDGGEPVRAKLATLRAFLAGEKNDDTRAVAKVMSALAADLPGTVYGRKIAAFLLAASA